LILIRDLKGFTINEAHGCHPFARIGIDMDEIIESMSR